MDCGTEYIKMCDCEEIQKQRVKSNGDFEVRFKNGVGTVEVYHHREITAHYKPENHLWLPRQDQLQEMVDVTVWDLDLPKPIALVEWINSVLFHNFPDGSTATNTYYEQFASMEQLWLAFVMKEKYHQVWNGDKWVWEEK